MLTINVSESELVNWAIERMFPSSKFAVVQVLQENGEYEIRLFESATQYEDKLKQEALEKGWE